MTLVLMVPLRCWLHFGTSHGVDLRANPACVLVLAQIVYRWAPKVAICLFQSHEKELSLPASVPSSRNLIVDLRRHT